MSEPSSETKLSNAPLVRVTVGPDNEFPMREGAWVSVLKKRRRLFIITSCPVKWQS